MKKHKELTKAEEEVMLALWKIESGYIKDILEQFPNPKPAYNTISTIVRILETKGFIKHKAQGKTHQYFPAVKKEDYTRNYMQGIMKGYFGNSFKNLVSFFVSNGELSMGDVNDLLKDIKKERKEEKKEKKEKKKKKK